MIVKLIGLKKSYYQTYAQLETPTHNENNSKQRTNSNTIDSSHSHDDFLYLGIVARKPVFGVSDKDSNQPSQLQRLARKLKSHL